MKYISLFFMLTLAVCVDMQAQKQHVLSISDIPAELKDGVNAVVQETRIKTYVTSKNQSYTEELQVISILNDKADFITKQGNFFDKSFHSKPVISGEIYDARGKMIKRFKNKDLQEQSAIGSGSIYQDDRWIGLDMSHINYPYTLVYRSKQQHQDMGILPPYWSLYPGPKVSVMLAELYVELVPEVGLKYKTHNIPVEVKTGNKDGKKTYTWLIQNKRPYISESYAPSRSNPFIRLAPENFEAGGLSGSHKSWEDFGRFMFELNKGRDELPEEMKAKVQNLVAGIDDPRKKVNTLYKYMQDNTRYVSVQLGIGGFQTFDADYVYKNGYGDCKALSNYMKSMLKEVGIPAYAGAIYGGDYPPPFYPEFSANQFNHKILCVPMAQDTMWLECTSDNNPAGYLGQFTEDRHILLDTPEGGKLVKTPSSSPEQNAKKRKIVLQLDEQGHAVVDFDAFYMGYAQDNIRGIVDKMPLKDQKKWLRKRIEFGSYDIESVSASNVPGNDRPCMQIQSTLKARNLASLSGNRLFLPLYAIKSPVSVPKSDKNRIQEIELPVPYLAQDTLTYELPANFHIEGMPDFPVKVTEDFGSFEMNLEILDPQTLRFTRSMRLEKMILPPERYEDFRNFFKQINKLDRRQVVLANKS